MVEQAVQLGFRRQKDEGRQHRKQLTGYDVR
jgi:hypothetical protein